MWRGLTRIWWVSEFLNEHFNCMLDHVSDLGRAFSWWILTLFSQSQLFSWMPSLSLFICSTWSITLGYFEAFPSKLFHANITKRRLFACVYAAMAWFRAWCWLLGGTYPFFFLLHEKTPCFVHGDNRIKESFFLASKLFATEGWWSLFHSVNACGTHAPCFWTLTIVWSLAIITWLAIFQVNSLVVCCGSSLIIASNWFPPNRRWIICEFEFERPPPWNKEALSVSFCR